MTSPGYLLTWADYDYAPPSYHERPGPLEEILHGIQPEYRHRDAYYHLTLQWSTEENAEALFAPGVTAADLEEMAVRGDAPNGTKLPLRNAFEVDLARVVVHRDYEPGTPRYVHVLRATKRGALWHYRVVDECPEETGGWVLPHLRSMYPLTLREIIAILDSAYARAIGPTRTLIWGHLADGNEVFITSSYYRDLLFHYSGNIRTWCRANGRKWLR